MTGAAFQDRRVRGVALALVLLKLWFVCAQPAVVVAGAMLDDRLFVQMADRIVQGNWLGDYDQFTLAKGPGYPLFIALTMVAGLPAPLAEHLLYLLGCWLLVRALRPVLRNDGWALLLFAGLAWQPMSYLMPGPWGGSVIRQNLYTPLTLLVFAGLVALHTRRNASATVRAAWSLLLGASAAWFWITREEGVWILPSAMCLVGVALVLAWRDDGSHWRVAWPAAVATTTMALGVATVSAINFHRYGWFGECEFHGQPFADAYGALLRVKAGEPKLRFPETRAMREATYPVSPAFAELRDALEKELIPAWTGGEGREINGGMWMWAFRDAVRKVGHAQTPAEAMAFYRRIADEVNAACDAGRVPAGPRHRSFVTPWTPMHTAEAKARIGQFARCFLLWEGFSARPPASQSHGDASLMLLFRDTLQWPLSPSADAPGYDTPRTKALRAWRIGALQSIGAVVRWIIVTASALGLVAWLAAAIVSVVRRRLPAYAWWVSTAALVGAVAVFAISFIVHVTAWFDLRPLRFSQAYPLVLVFSGAAIVAALTEFQRARVREGDRRRTSAAVVVA